MPDTGVDGSVVISINGDTSNFDDSIDHVTDKSKNLNSILNHALGNVLSDALRSAANGIKELADEIVQTGISFESAFAGVKKTVDETATISYEDINNQLREMAKNLPATYEEIAGVAEAAGQLGIKTENLTDFTQVMIDLGEATNLSADEAAVALAQLANVTKMSADDYDNMGSAIVHLGNNMATTEADIVNMAQRLGSTAAVAGISNQNIVAMAAALGSVGVSAEVGGTAMSSFISKMQSAVSSGDTKLEKFAETAGMTKEAFAELFNNDAMGAIEAFIDGLHKLDAEGGDALGVLKDVGVTDTRMRNAVLSLAKNGEILGEAVNMANQAWEENTALAEEAAQRYQTTESQLRMLQNRLRDFYYDLSQSLGADMSGFMDLENLSDIFDRVKAKIEDGNLAQSLAGIVEQLAGLAEKAADFTIDDGLPALLRAFEWINEHGTEIIGILKAIVASFMADKAMEYAKPLGLISNALGDLGSNDPSTMLQNVGNLLKDGKTSWDIYTIAIQGAATAATLIANEIDAASAAIERNTQYLNDFTDASNDAYDAYVKLNEEAKTNPLGAGAYSAEHLEDDKKALAKYEQQVHDLDKAIEELTASSANEYGVVENGDALNQINELKKRRDEANRTAEAYRNLVHAEEKYYVAPTEEVKSWKEQLADLDKAHASGLMDDTAYWRRRKQVLEENRHMEDHDWQVYMDEVTQHYRDLGKAQKTGQKSLEEELKDLDSQYNKQSIEDQKKNAAKYYKARLDIIDKHRNEESEEWWKLRNETQSNYDKLSEEEKKDAEEYAKKSAQALRDSVEQKFKDLELQKVQEGKTDEWLNEEKRKVIEGLDHNSDLYKEYDYQLRYRSAQTTNALNEDREKRFQNAAYAIADETKNGLKQEISDVKSAFDSLAKEYQSGYDAIISERDNYKQQLMGGSIFTTKEITDARTGETHKIYGVDDLRKRLQDRRTLMQKISELQAKGLSQGIINELYNMEPSEALEFARQLDSMSDNALNKISADYDALDAETTRLANERYAGELDALKTGFTEQATALFSGMSDDLATIGGNAALAYINGFTSGVIDNENLQSSVDAFFDTLSTNLEAGTINLDGVIRDNLVGEGLADELIDGVLAEIHARGDEVRTAVQEIMDLSDQTSPIISDVENRAAQQSASGYAAATQASQATRSSTTAGNQSGDLTVHVEGKFTDEDGRTIGTIVNRDNERTSTSAGI